MSPSHVVFHRPHGRLNVRRSLWEMRNLGDVNRPSIRGENGSDIKCRSAEGLRRMDFDMRALSVTRLLPPSTVTTNTWI